MGRNSKGQFVRKIFTEEELKQHKRQWTKHYYETHKEECKQRSIKWKRNHPEQKRIMLRNWRKNNPEKVRESNKRNHKKSYRPHPLKRLTPEELKLHDKKSKTQYYNAHKEECDQRTTNWRKNHPEWRGKQTRKQKYKRRGLGHDFLNEPFEGSHGHHIDFECVVYIPEKLHNSIRHNIWSGRGMFEINDKAFEWLIEHDSSGAKFISNK
jgi:hypothetical protein